MSGAKKANGYDAMGIQRIVEAARITKPTLYHYFGSKQGLLALRRGNRIPFLVMFAWIPWREDF